MTKKILFLNTGHYSHDDRVFYHQAKCLLREGYRVEIISTKEDKIGIDDGIIIHSYNDSQLGHQQKVNKMVDVITEAAPDIIIADTPPAVIAASVYRRKNKVRIVYDITEWYPSKKNLRSTKFPEKSMKVVVLSLLNLYAGWLSDFFIFGEHFKSLPFTLFFFWKRAILLPYYPDMDYIRTLPLQKPGNVFRLTFSGLLNNEKGLHSVLESVYVAARHQPETEFHLRLIGYFSDPDEEAAVLDRNVHIPVNYQVEIIPYLPFPEYCRIIGDTDLFLDLRKADLENKYCLPIKLFYYMACGRPVIYTDLRSIRKTFKTIDFGYLVDPENAEEVAQLLTNYIKNKELYQQHCENALQHFHDKFNWKSIEADFIRFIRYISL